MKKIVIHEYNVTPRREERDELSISIENEIILYNDKKIENLDMANELRMIFEQNIEKIKNISQKRVQNSKGGRQKSFSIIDGENRYNVIGNTNDEDSKNLYLELRNKVLDILRN